MQRAKKLIESDKVVAVKVSGKKMVGEIRGRKKGDLHVATIFEDGSFSCGCVGQSTNPTRLCSHLIATLIHGDDDEYIQRVDSYLASKAGDEQIDEKLAVFSESDFFPTTLKGLNELLKGGVPYRKMFGVYGAFKAGKSIFCQQLAWEVMAYSDQNALLFDTESDYFAPDAIPIWADRFNKRFKIDAQIVKVSFVPVWGTTKGEKDIIKQIKVHFEPSRFNAKKQTAFIVDEGKLEILLAFHGKPVRPHMKGGKIDLFPMDTGLYVFYINQSMAGEFVEKHNIKFVSYDSITRLYTPYHGGRVNYQVRNEAENLFFSQVDELAKTYNMVCVCTHRQTDNPTDKYDRPRPKGGRAVGHWFKRMIHLNKIGSTVKRRMKVFRVPTEAEWDEGTWESERFAYLSNQGFRDLVEKK